MHPSSPTEKEIMQVQALRRTSLSCSRRVANRNGFCRKTELAWHPSRVERKSLEPGANIGILRRMNRLGILRRGCMPQIATVLEKQSGLGGARGICYSRRTDDDGE